MTIKLKPPIGVTSIVGKSGAVYTAGADGSYTVDNNDVSGLLAAGCTFWLAKTKQFFVEAALPADLVSIKAAATPANGAITIAAQPVHARKLQVRVVIGTTTTTAITAGTLTLVYIDQDGTQITEVISLIATASTTILTKYAVSRLVSGTVAAYAANGSGTGNTLGIGVSNDFGIPTENGGANILNFSCLKVTKATKVLGTSITAADDVAATATVDATARTIAPTTAPAANGLVDFAFVAAYN